MTTNSKITSMKLNTNINRTIAESVPSTTGDPANLVSRMVAANELANNPEVVKEIRKYGKVPVVYMPTKAMMRPAPTPGLLDFIRKAKTVEEVNNLLSRTSKFENAHPGTVRKWNKAAKSRISELEFVSKLNPREGQTPLESLIEKKPKRKTRKVDPSKMV